MVGSQGLNGRKLAEGYGWLLVLPIVAYASASFTLHFLDNISTSPWRWLPLILGASAPALWIAAWIAPGALVLTLLKAHAALYTATVLAIFAMVTQHHGNGFAALAQLIDWSENIGVLLGDAIVVAIAAKRIRTSSPDRKGLQFVYVGLTVAFLGGWYAGVLAWSSAFRPRLVVAVETLVQDQPYCIEVDGRPVRTADDITGLRMRARNEEGWTYNFHALLVIGARPDRTYLNWSYRSGHFEPVTSKARLDLHLDDRVTCKPVMHFALNLM